MTTEIIRVPDLGDSGEVEIIELLVSVGQTVSENESLLVLESEKAAMEIPAPMGGIVKSIAVNLGDMVKTGSEMLTLETGKAANASPKPLTESASGAVKNETQKPVKQNKTIESEVKQSIVKPVAEASPSPASIPETLYVPDLGGEKDVEVIEIHVKPGDEIGVDDTLITLESDKAAMDVPSESAGKIKELRVKLGDKVSKGSPILDLMTVRKAVTEASPAKINEPGDSGLPSPVLPTPKASDSDSMPVNKPEVLSVQAGEVSSEVYAGPAVRKLARELGVTLEQVSGSGGKGRILKEDIHDYVKSRISTSTGPQVTTGALPDIDFSQFGEIDRVQRSKLHKLTAVNMQRNWSSIPHVAQFNEADVTDLEAFRAQMHGAAERKGVKLTFLPFLLKACAKALKEYPQFNVSLHSGGEFLIQKKYVHIGVAVATEAGLVVPVIRNVDQKSLWELAAEIIEITGKAKQRRLSREDLQGACFSISSLGAIGGTGFIPIINAPEVAILGVGKTQVKPVFQNNSFVPRNMLPLTLSYDHRALNGVDGGQFSSFLVEMLGDIRLLLL